MAYINVPPEFANEIVVDAVLTNAGLEKMAKGSPINITMFGLFDPEIDYSLYNSNDPNGSDFFDTAISKLPMLEARKLTDDTTTHGLVNTPQGGGGIVIYTLDLPISLDFTEAVGVSKANQTYNLTPAVSPTPSDNDTVFYEITITATPGPDGAVIDLSSFDLVGNLEAGKKLTPILIAERNRIQREKDALAPPAITIFTSPITPLPVDVTAVVAPAEGGQPPTTEYMVGDGYDSNGKYFQDWVTPAGTERRYPQVPPTSPTIS